MMFYVLSALTLIFALGAVLAKNLLHAAVFLMGLLSTVAGLYLFVGAEFLAGVQVLVYVGGVVVLLVFAVMLTRTQDLVEDVPAWPRRLAGAFAATLFFVLSWPLLHESSFQSISVRQSESVKRMIAPTAEIGRKLLDRSAQGYLLAFELISLLLLAVLVGGIVIARKSEAKS